MSDQSMVDILTCTYNHEAYIERCIQGVVSQKVNFKIRHLIGDDKSIDATREIIQKYHQSNPDILELVMRQENIGAFANSRDLFNRTKAKYIALLDGDDYWTDINKLQKQVDFLETNDDYSICFHNAAIKNSNDEGEKVYCVNIPEETTIEDLFLRNYIPTASVVFRNNEDPFPKWIDDMPIGDWPLHLNHARFGKVKYFDQVMSVYRTHDTSTWSTKSKLEMLKGLETFFVKLKELGLFKDHTNSLNAGMARNYRGMAVECRNQRRLLKGLSYLYKYKKYGTGSQYNPRPYLSYIKQFYS